jgi:hypothetical protein
MSKKVIEKVAEGLNRPVFSWSRVTTKKNKVETINIGFRLWEVGAVAGMLWLTGLIKGGKTSQQVKSWYDDLARRMLRLPP